MPIKERRTVVVNITASGALVAAVTGCVIQVRQICLTGSAAVSIKFQSATTDLTGPMSIGAGMPLNPQEPEPGEFLFATALDEALNAVQVGAGTIGGFLIVHIVSKAVSGG